MKQKLLWLSVILISVAVAAFLFLHFPLPEEPIVLSPRENSSPAVRSFQEEESISPRINVNTANEETLCMLPGIGPSIAKKMIREREENGFFHYPQDLRSVNGIGEKTLQKIVDYICFE